MVTLHHVITVYNDISNLMDGIVHVSGTKKTQWKELLYFAVQFARQKLSKYCTEVTPTMGTLLISGHILEPSQKLRLSRKLDYGMDIDPENKTSFTIQYQKVFPECVENEYCTKQ